MSYDTLTDGQHYSRGPRAIHTQSLPTHESVNHVPYSMFKPHPYSEDRILQLLKKGIGSNGSIRSHTPAVRESIVESIKPYPELFKHYIKS